jgi:hypothetical protein
LKRLTGSIELFISFLVKLLLTEDFVLVKKGAFLKVELGNASKYELLIHRNLQTILKQIFRGKLIMLIASKLLDSFMNALNEEQRERIYQTAVGDIDEAMALMANMYERIFGDYPTGFVAAFIQQHLKDKVFQRTHFKDAAAA